MFYPNQLVFTSMHPVAYTVKLNIEMSMGSLIRKIATSRENDFQVDPSHAYSLHSAAAPGPAALNRSTSNPFRATRTSHISDVQASDDNTDGKLSDDARRIFVTEQYENSQAV